MELNNINDIRKEIDELDRELVSLFISIKNPHFRFISIESMRRWGKILFNSTLNP